MGSGKSPEEEKIYHRGTEHAEKNQEKTLTADDTDVADEKNMIVTFQEHERGFICVICVIGGLVF